MIYLHIGNNHTVKIKDIVGIFDADTATISEVTRKYLKEAQKKDEVQFARAEVPKSFVLYRDGGRYKIAFSPLAPGVLMERTNS